MAGETELVISGDGMPPTAVRGITETLQPVDNPQFDKYRLTITCSDKNSPAFDAVRAGNWRRTVNGGLIDLSGHGSTLVVDCVSELAYADGVSPSGPQRTVVDDSEWTSDGFVFYRPRLTVGVISKSQETDEYGAVTSWTLVCEEV